MLQWDNVTIRILHVVLKNKIKSVQENTHVTFRNIYWSSQCSSESKYYNPYISNRFSTQSVYSLSNTITSYTKQVTLKVTLKVF